MKLKITLLFGLLISTLSHAQQLEELIEIALKNNPQLNSLAFKTKAVKEGELQAKSWENTSLGTGVFLSEPETRTGPQRYQLSASQIIPSFGRISARENYARSLSDISHHQWVIAQRKLILELSYLYYDYQVILRQQLLTKEHINRINRYIDISTAKVSAAQSALIDVMELKMKREELLNLKSKLETNQELLNDKFKLLLNNQSAFEIQFDHEFVIDKTLTLEADYKLSIHPELVEFNLLFESLNKQKILNQKESFPTIGVGINYIDVGTRTDLNPIDNGKDILIPKLSLSVPIFNKSYQSKNRQLIIKEEELRSNMVQRKNELESYLHQAIINKKEAIKDYESLEKNIQLANQSIDLALSYYQTNSMGIEKILELQQLEFNYKLKQLSSIGHYFKQQLKIAYILN